jgi:hypothetical protein
VSEVCTTTPTDTSNKVPVRVTIVLADSDAGRAFAERMPGHIKAFQQELPNAEFTVVPPAPEGASDKSASPT